ncbi:MAG: VanZ family protein [Turicibacter sp.]|nr:VanZ family protein [Turicibacter sp.]
MKRQIKWLALFGWMLIIFLFSAQTGEQSSESSGLIEQLLSFFSFIPPTLFGIELQVIIRKTAHFSEYFILYLLSVNVLLEYLTVKKSIYSALIFVFLYACTDEFHQLFVPDRVCAFTDVLIDTSGGALAMLSLLAIDSFKQR